MGVRCDIETLTISKYALSVAMHGREQGGHVQKYSCLEPDYLYNYIYFSTIDSLITIETICFIYIYEAITD